MLKSGYEEYKDLPYFFGYFDNGVPIPRIARRIYLHSTKEARARFGNPFETGKNSSFFNWLNKKTEISSSKNKQSITNLQYAIYESRPDIKAAFPNIFSRFSGDFDRFLEWLRENGKSALGLHDCFMENKNYGR